MENFDKFIETFITGDYFLIFLVLVLMILLVLVLALIKVKNQYDELILSEKRIVKTMPSKTPEVNEIDTEKDIIEDLNQLITSSTDDKIDFNMPLLSQIDDAPVVKQVDVKNTKTYENIIEDYESSEEENAVISAEELEKKTRERMEVLGLNDNQAAIQKYEEEQEKKAIISYEQLVKNASNISLLYKEEEVSDGCPKINKIEVQEKEVTPPENYLAEEEFLSILKEFRLSLE